MSVILPFSLIEGKLVKNICKRRLRIFCYISFVCFLNSGISSSYGLDFLSPEDPYLLNVNEYSMAVNTVFREILDEEKDWMVFVKPSFESEYVLEIREDNFQYFVKRSSPNYSISNVIPRIGNLDFTNNTQNLELEDIDLNITQRAITSELANLIKFLIQEELVLTRFPEKAALTLDGTTFHFSMFVPGIGYIGGKLASLDTGSSMEALSNLMESLYKYVDDEIDEGEIYLSASLLRSRRASSFQSR